jgi:hypothetical protein
LSFGEFTTAEEVTTRKEFATAMAIRGDAWGWYKEESSVE